MQFVQARDLKVGDRLIVGDTSYRADEVTIGQSRVAIRSATYDLGPITHPANTEVLIEDRVPVVKPEPTPPAPQWSIKYTKAYTKLVNATLTHGDGGVRYGPWRNTEAEALNGLLQLWGAEIEAATCAVNGCDQPRVFGSTICGRAHR